MLMTDHNPRFRLTPEEQDILQGRQGPTMQKVMRTVVLYGKALGAERLVNIEGDGHFVIAYAIPGIAPSMEMLDELAAADLKSEFPFTLDPKPPLDYENWFLTQEQIQLLKEMYRNQPRYDERMLELGLRDSDACTCTPYLPEVGNIPQRGDILAWSESACAMGRLATWLVEVRTEKRPLPQLLGSAIGNKVLADVPFIVGLDRFLGSELNEETRDYLHEMGAACATAGAVGLYHVDKITPEAVEYGTQLLAPNYQTYEIGDQELQTLLASYPVLWAEKDATPEKCFVGCPHLSLQQLNWWADRIHGALQARRQSRLAVKTTLCAAPQVLQQFKTEAAACARLERAGVRLSAGCPMQLFDNDLSAGEAIITNSNKLRAYTAARFFPDEELVEILADGEIRPAPAIGRPASFQCADSRRSSE